MKFINQLPIKIKLVLIVLAVSLPVLILFAIFNILVNMESYKDRLKSEIDNVAKMTTDYTQPFLLMQDLASTEQMIQFQKLTSIDYACIYDEAGDIVSEYRKPPEGVVVRFKQDSSSTFKGNYLHTFSNATYEGEIIGTLFILANNNKIKKLINQSIRNTLIAIIISVLISLILVLILQRFISRPILNLANFTENITNSPDHGQRIPNIYQDEIGTLYNSFNTMLDAIESTTVSRGYLNDILSSMAEMLIVLDNDFKIQKINEAVVEQMGYSSKELIGKKIDILLKTMTTDDFYQHDIIETNFYSKSSERKIVSISLSGLNTDSETSQNSTIICTARDITEKERAKEELRDNINELVLTQNQLKIAKELAEASSQAKSEFLSKMSHEIRTPMNAIMGMAHFLLQNNPSTEQRNDLEDLLLSTESLLTLINDILDFSQIESGQVIFQKREFDLHQLIQKVVRTYENEKISMSLNLDNRIPIHVKGDEKRLTQILTNLVQNAVKFTEKGRVKVEAELDSFDKSKAYVRFIIKDTGIGIPEDKIGLIFESFSQVDNSLTRQYQGKGLGLSIVKQLLELQGSTIHVESEVSKGSTFSFVLGFELSKKANHKAVKSKPFGESLKGTKILLVEDNRMNIIVTKKLLKNWDIEVEVALNGKIGVEKASADDYNIILMDLQMPIMDGFESTRQIRTTSRHKETPIIALTAEVMEESQEKAMEVGMNDFVTKPFKPNVLYQAIAQFVD